MKIVSIIPIKSTSSRIENKNTRILGDKPLFIHTLDTLLSINTINEVWIDTDSQEIIDLAHSYGYANFHYFLRDKKYATNATDGNLLMRNEIEIIDADIYVQVLCTSPFTRKSSLTKIVDLLKSP